MAKWGEGDPRWIVEERPDATNVNNWHWTEKNACAWSIDKIKELLINFTIETDEAKCIIMEVEKCEGEAVANNRKGKLIFFYEWDIVLKWQGALTGGDKDVEGTINIPNLSEENDVTELDIIVSLKDSDPEADKLKECLLKDGKEQIKAQLGKYIIALKEEFSKGMILPKRDDSNSSKSDSVAGLSAEFNKQVQMNNSDKSEVRDCKIPTTTVHFTQLFYCSSDMFYNVMTTLELVRAFTRGPAKLNATIGGKFKLFGGNIHGEFIDLVPNKTIVQKWRYKGWPLKHYSIVTIDIEQKSDHTEVRVKQTGVPESDADTIEDNWNRYYWQGLKTTLGFEPYPMLS